VRRLIPVLVVTAVGFSTAHAAPAKTSPFSTKYHGEGGGYKHPDGEVGDFFETKPEAPAELKPERPQVPAKITPEIQPAAAAPSRPRPRPFAPAPAAASNPDRAASEARMPARSEAGAAQAAGKSDMLDSASEDARRDYESRLFGAEPAPRRPGLAGSEERAPADSGPRASMSEGMLFVSLELDPLEAGALRDAVAGLAASAAFRPDARFQPLPGPGGSVRISGWLPASRLGDAIGRPGVRRVAVERGARPADDARVTGDYLVSLRVSDAARPVESAGPSPTASGGGDSSSPYGAVAESVRVLTAATGFKLDRVVAIETVAGGHLTAHVSGTMPVSQLSRALALPGVIKIGPAAGPAAASDFSEAAGRIQVKKEGFLKFVMERSLWLVLLTLLLALPSMAEAIRKGLAVFVPYR